MHPLGMSRRRNKGQHCSNHLDAYAVPAASDVERLAKSLPRCIHGPHRRHEKQIFPRDIQMRAGAQPLRSARVDSNSVFEQPG